MSNILSSSMRTPLLRQVVCAARPHLRGTTQRRWAQVHDVRFLATHIDPLEKYRSKLDKKAKEEGLKDVNELQQAYKDKIAEYRRSASTVVTPEPSQPASSTPAASTSSPFPPPPPPPSPAQSQPPTSKSGAPGIKPLSSYLDLNKIKDLPNKEIEVIWRLRHAKNPSSLCAVVPLSAYKRIYQTAKQNPQFIIPLPRTISEAADGTLGSESDAGEKTTGAEIHFLQWAFHPPASPPADGLAKTENTHTSTILFTNLAAYKLHGSYAQPHTIVTHHLDLADSHGLVLLNGSIVPDKGISADEARWLLMCVQRFYDFGGEGKGRKAELLRMFSQGDTEGFSVQELMDETEKIG